MENRRAPKRIHASHRLSIAQGVNEMDQKRNEQTSNQAQEVAKVLRQEGKGEISSDVSGSYTGTPIDGGVPVQDADDL